MWIHCPPILLSLRRNGQEESKLLNLRRGYGLQGNREKRASEPEKPSFPGWKGKTSPSLYLRSWFHKVDHPTAPDG